MPNTFASSKNSIAECDRCGFGYKLKQLKPLVIKTVRTNIMVCPSCWEKDHPQLMLGMYPVYDPQAVREPRNDTSYAESRDIQWGWAPVGGASQFTTGLTPNNLVATTSVGVVTIAAT